MKVLVIGPTGLLGTPILAEAAARGHDITALCRHPDQVTAHDNVTAVKGDAFDTDGLSAVAAGHDAVIHAYSPRRDHDTNKMEPHMAATRSIIAATKRAGVPRLLACGGAGALEVAPGVRLIDTPRTPPQFRESGLAAVAIFELLEQEQELDWTYLCPSGRLITDGERTGTFRLDTKLIEDIDGDGAITSLDYAVAMIDELENPAHSRMLFAVGY